MTSVDPASDGPNDHGARKRARVFDFGYANRGCARDSVIQSALRPLTSRFGRTTSAKNIFERLIMFGHVRYRLITFG